MARGSVRNRWACALIETILLSVLECLTVAKKEKRRNSGGDTTASLNRHKGQCSICSHEKRKEIEAAFVAWESPEKIAAEYGLTHRGTVYRHAKAFGLNVKRQQNIRVPLERIIERAGDPSLQVTGATVVQAIAVYGKLNAQGQLIERRETLNLNELFERMTIQEKEARGLRERRHTAGVVYANCRESSRYRAKRKRGRRRRQIER